MKRLMATLREQFQEAAKPEKAIRANLKSLGFEILMWLHFVTTFGDHIL